MIPRLNGFYRCDTPLHGLQTVEVITVHKDAMPYAYTIQWCDPDGHIMTAKTNELLRFLSVATPPAPAMSRTEELEDVIRRAHAADNGYDAWSILDEWVQSQEKKS